MNIFLFERTQIVVDVLTQILVKVCLLHDCTEGAPKGSHSILRHILFGMYEGRCIKQVLLELQTELYGQVAKGTFAATEFVEVLIYSSPFVALIVSVLFKVGQEVHLLFVVIQEAEFLIDDWGLAHATDGKCFLTDFVLSG